MYDLIWIELDQLFVTLGIVEDITRVHALAIDFDPWLQQSRMSISQTAMLLTYICVVMHICIGG